MYDTNCFGKYISYVIYMNKNADSKHLGSYYILDNKQLSSIDYECKRLLERSLYYAAALGVSMWAIWVGWMPVINVSNLKFY